MENGSSTNQIYIRISYIKMYLKYAKYGVYELKPLKIYHLYSDLSSFLYCKCTNVVQYIFGVMTYMYFTSYN